MKKMKMLLLLPSLCLASCSSNSFYGTYEFRLGKTDGAHIGLTIELTKDDNKKHENTKNFVLSAEFGSDFSIENMLKEYTEKYPILELLLDDLLKLLPEEKKVDGYYSVSDSVNPTYGNRVKIGSDIIGDLVKKAYPDLDIEDLDLLTSPEMVEKLVCAYVNAKQFTFQIPVSLNDLQMQLAWYGSLIDFEGARIITTLDESKLPGPVGEDRIGVHPVVTKERDKIIASEVNKMNEAFEFEFSHTYLYQIDEVGTHYAVGSFLTKTNDKDEQYLCFKPFEESMSLLDITGQVRIKKALGDEYVDIKFSASSGSKEAVVTPNGKKGNEEGFIDANGKEFLYSELMKTPFTFRDFHDVKVGLTKI